MTETENLKSCAYSTPGNNDIQIKVLQDELKAQNILIKEYQKAIAEQQAKLDMTINIKSLLQERLSNIHSVNHTTQVGAPNVDAPISIGVGAPINQEPTQRQKHRQHLEKQVIKVLKEVAGDSFYGEKGMMAGEIREKLIRQDSILRVSPNTIGHVLGDLSKENLVKCVTPEQQTRHRRFVIAG